MVINSNKQIKCHNCGQEFKVNTYDRVDVTDDQDLKQSILHAEIFKHECPHCHQQFLFNSPCLLIDQQKKYMIWLINEVIKQDLPLLSEMLKDYTEYKLRYVETIADFIEKFQVFEDEVNDVVCEMGKVLCEKQIKQQTEQEEIQDIIYYQRQDEYIIYQVITANKQELMKLNYDVLEQAYNHHHELYALAAKQYVLVNQKTVQKKMEIDHNFQHLFTSEKN